MTLNVIDVAKDQPNIEPANMPDVQAVIVGCTAGTVFVNPWADTQFQKSKAANKKRGFYHIPVGIFDPIGEANFFVAHCRNYFGDAIPILDWEETDTTRADLAYEFLSEVRKLTGVAPWIYMDEAAFNALAREDGSNGWEKVWAEFSLWIAQYRYSSAVIGFHPDWTYPAEIAKWPVVAAYQYASTGQIAGYSGNLDISAFYGDEAAWDRYSMVTNVHNAPAPAPIPEPVPKPIQTFTAVVSEGDTFTSIASQFGVTLAALEAVNPGINYELIHEGQVINVPGNPPAAPAPVRGVRGIWRVDPGENLTMVANYYGVTVAQICQWNNIANPNIIYPGQMLNIY